jgi:undecaprenyl diphosphate synthase
MAERIRRGALDGSLGDAPIEAETLHRMLPSAIVPPVDLLIRTGGDSRVSNFLPWQLTYAELLFVPALWPDFGDPDLEAACEEFSRRKRRFGRVEAATPHGNGRLR